MTDRARTLIVALEEEMRVDDAEYLMSAIRMMRGVAGVAADVANPGAYSAEMAARHHIRSKIWKIITTENP